MRKTIFVCLSFTFAVSIFSGCEHGAKSGSGGGGGIIVTVAEGDYKYFSLVSGGEVTKTDTQNWDIGFQRPRTIVTNGGDTAIELRSRGEGMVWYTNKTDFDSVTLSDAVGRSEIDPELMDYTQDKKKYLFSMSKLQHNTLNVMNYTGYSEGNGTEGNPFKTYTYTKKEFYDGKNGRAPTKEVYIIRHGDGIHHSKIQVSQYEYNGANTTDSYVVKYEALD
ncbi:MAG: HmuY family protein [Spirochaetaceae bacterium]|jgi:hypothetical protein|nr:HmuY family protein [Spirochaetaceae bacterium]